MILGLLEGVKEEEENRQWEEVERKARFHDREEDITSIIRKSSVYAELLLPLRLVAILETNKLKLLSFSFMISK